MMKLLLIEDDRQIALALSQALANSYIIKHAVSGQAALNAAKSDSFDLILLDLNLPDMPGIEVCLSLRDANCSLPILILSGEAQVMSKIRLLDAGANDYLTKPFSLGELKARLRVLQRQQPPQSVKSLPQLEVADLVLDRRSRSARRQGQPLQLRRKEFALLECLMQQAGAVVSRQALGDYAWHDSDTPWANTIDVHIKYLRDKIDRPFETRLIQTVHGFGYKIQAPSAVAAGVN